jgi:PD-(D/E)XK endonuclease
MQHPKDIGDRSTLAIIFALHTQGYTVLLPFGENSRYDLVIDNGSLRRVQCKTGRFRNGCVMFRTSSTYAHHPNPKIRSRTYAGEIDEFAVYCPELGSIYLIPIEDVDTAHHATLRVEPSRNGQHKRVRFAAMYEIGRLELI